MSRRRRRRRRRRAVLASSDNLITSRLLSLIILRLAENTFSDCVSLSVFLSFRPSVCLGHCLWALLLLGFERGRRTLMSNITFDT